MSRSASDEATQAGGAVGRNATRARIGAANECAGAVGERTGIAPVLFARRFAWAVCTLCVAVLLLASGFIVCVLPPVTGALAEATSRTDAHTAFSHDDMVSIACATRDYSFGSHNRDALMQAICAANVDAAARAAASGRALAGAPSLSGVDVNDSAQVERAFAGANERFVYSPDALSHLDDCFAVAQVAYAVLAVIAVLAILCFWFEGSRRSRGCVLFGAGAFVLALFGVLGIWAVIDFDGLFTVFHGLLFSQGNWTFPADSLLICALPTEFWMGMGTVWLATTSITSILSILVGRKLLKAPAA